MKLRDHFERFTSELSYDAETGIISRNSDGRRITSWINKKGYDQVSYKGSTIRGHILAWRLITGAWPDKQIDHINGVRSDNRKQNLRLATNTENSRNKRCSLAKSGIKGVSWDRNRNKWSADIGVDYRHISLGKFPTKEEAAEAYAAAARKYFGEFACVESPPRVPRS